MDPIMFTEGTEAWRRVSYAAPVQNRQEMRNLGNSMDISGKSTAAAGNPYGARELPYVSQEGYDPRELAVRGMVNYRPEAEYRFSPSGEGEEVPGVKTDKAESPAQVMEEAECKTCAKRKYQDGSDDPGVSFKSPTRVAPELAAAAVRGHEQEHVVRERAKAEREDRKVISQTVTYHTGICPECGRFYVAGGTTRTVTAAKDPKPDETPDTKTEVEME